MNDFETNFRANAFISVKKGFDPNILLTQATLETGHFRSSLCFVHNYFGIKNYKQWKGGITDKDTFEIVNGKKIYIKDAFIKLPDVIAGINIYTVLIEKYHPKSWSTRTEPKEYFKNIASWSTSPDYTQSLTKLYEELLWGDYGGLI